MKRLFILFGDQRIENIAVESPVSSAIRELSSIPRIVESYLFVLSGIHNTMKAFLVLLAALAFAVAPLLSPEFGGFDPDRYPIPQNDPPVQPAGWAFAIWGLIYAALVLHAFYGVARHRHDESWNRGRIALFISLAIGSIWLPIALLSPIWATLLIWVMLISVLVSLYQTPSAGPSWVANWPVALYAGWLSAASFVSIGLLLAGYGFVSEIAAAILSLILATAFALFNALRLNQWCYSAAVAWGFFGITIANLNTELLVAVPAAIATIIMIVLSIRSFRVSAAS